MGTRSTIGMSEGFKVKAIYCHWDGYPEGVGATLAEHYTDAKKVRQLLELGNISALRQEIGEAQEFNSPKEEWTIAYGRDRGDSNISAKTDLYEELIKDQNVDYVYIFDGDHWECYDTQYTLAINLYTK